MSIVLIIAEHRNGRLKKSTFELIQHSSQAGNETHAVLLGEGDFLDALANELGKYGAKKVHLCKNVVFKNYTGEAYSQAILQLVKQLNPDILLTSHTPTGRDLLPRVAAQLNVGIASDCTQLVYSGKEIQVRRPIYAGKATVEVEFLGTGPRLATIRPNALGLPKNELSGSAEILPFSPSLGQMKTKVLDIVQGASGRPDVTEAAIVVSGGRSLKTAENFKILEDMADVLGAGVGASRAAVDAGLRPHRDQVGQTGKVVSPSLYIACGISGAIQHLAGMRTSKIIVAINTDSEAPIFQVADYGIVGDLFTLVPLLTEELKKVKDHS